MLWVFLMNLILEINKRIMNKLTRALIPRYLEWRKQVKFILNEEKPQKNMVSPLHFQSPLAHIS
jgi:hypothetical protein